MFVTRPTLNMPKKLPPTAKANDSLRRSSRFGHSSTQEEDEEVVINTNNKTNQNRHTQLDPIAKIDFSDLHVDKCIGGGTFPHVFKLKVHNTNPSSDCRQCN